MTFFFQLKIPSFHKSYGKTISMFCATDYINDQMHIPKLPNPLKGASLTEDFFNDYQSFFKIYVFDDRVDLNLYHQYEDVLAFHELKFQEEVREGQRIFGEISEAPNWILDDETPKEYNGRADAIDFLFQVKEEYYFEKTHNAPRQKVIDYSRNDNGYMDSFSDEYTLFTSNELYFFLAGGGDGIFPYVVPQS
ncbi:hypothetical protein [Nitratireductor sp. ZSWI3]|uniref:hypothetical protein n=1 Tax=Nitratireductor sp. ZSWI3 TaxID=2966359 RepID=UPI00214FD54F|nr:hypothetical protein [Nitratireductor sp. ZSWI3]MCR4268986.1 hypothetical protein [Nitratireductor sp. ZSWI3]